MEIDKIIAILLVVCIGLSFLAHMIVKSDGNPMLPIVSVISLVNPFLVYRHEINHDPADIFIVFLILTIIIGYFYYYKDKLPIWFHKITLTSLIISTIVNIVIIICF